MNAVFYFLLRSMSARFRGTQSFFSLFKFDYLTLRLAKRGGQGDITLKSLSGGWNQVRRRLRIQGNVFFSMKKTACSLGLVSRAAPWERWLWNWQSPLERLPETPPFLPFCCARRQQTHASTTSFLHQGIKTKSSSRNLRCNRADETGFLFLFLSSLAPGYKIRNN